MESKERYECPSAELYEMEAGADICVGSNGEDTQTVGEIEYNGGWII